MIYKTTLPLEEETGWKKEDKKSRREEMENMVGALHTAANNAMPAPGLKKPSDPNGRWELVVG